MSFRIPIKQFLIASILGALVLPAVGQSPRTWVKAERLDMTQTLTHYCVSISDSGHFRWEARVYSAGLSKPEKSKGFAVEGDLSDAEKQSLQQLLEVEPLKTFERPQFHVPPGSKAFITRNPGVVEIQRPDHVQRIVFGTLLGAGNVNQVGQVMMQNLSSSDDQDKILQPLMKWLVNEIEKPHKKQLVASDTVCATPELSQKLFKPPTP